LRIIYLWGYILFWDCKKYFCTSKIYFPDKILLWLISWVSPLGLPHTNLSMLNIFNLSLVYLISNKHFLQKLRFYIDTTVFEAKIYFHSLVCLMYIMFARVWRPHQKFQLNLVDRWSSNTIVDSCMSLKFCVLYITNTPQYGYMY